MGKQKILENDFATMWFYPEAKIIHHKINNSIYGKEFREFFMKGAEFFEDKNCNKWLSDDRNNSALRNEDIAWGYEHWKPRVINAGWKYWAMMMPDKAIGKIAMRLLVKDTKNHGVTVEIFDDLDEALQWLIGKG